MNDNMMREEIVGSRNGSSLITMLVLLFAGLGFFLAGISSYLHLNLLKLTDTSQISFIPQGVAMLFYGTGALGLAIYIILTIIWNIGSGYNEFSKIENVVPSGKYSAQLGKALNYILEFFFIVAI